MYNSHQRTVTLQQDGDQTFYPGTASEVAGFPAISVPVVQVQYPFNQV
jgi:hypothetical protein